MQCQVCFLVFCSIFARFLVVCMCAWKKELFSCAKRRRKKKKKCRSGRRRRSQASLCYEDTTLKLRKRGDLTWYRKMELNLFKIKENEWKKSSCFVFLVKRLCRKETNKKCIIRLLNTISNRIERK